MSQVSLPAHSMTLSAAFLQGFELNLDDIRLVQFSLDEDAIWITERQKLHAKAMGKKYLDMYVVSFWPSTCATIYF